MTSKVTSVRITELLSIFCYRCNYILLFGSVFISFQARSQSEEILQHQIIKEPQKKHDSIYYELFKLNRTSDQVKAKQYVTLAFQLSHQHKHPLLYAKACNGLAYLFVQANQTDSSFTYYHKAIQVCRVNNFTDRLVYLYNDLGRLHERLDVYDSALYYFVSSLELANQTQSFKDQAIAYFNIGVIHFHLENYKEALVNFKRAVKLESSKGIKEGTTLDWLTMALTYNEMGNYNAAFHRLKAVETECKNGCDDFTLGNLNYGFGYYNLKRGRFNNACTFFKRSIPYARKSNDQQTVAWAMFRLSFYDAQAGHYDQAIKAVKDAEKIAVQIGHKRLLREIYNQLSILYDKTNTMDKARQYERLYSRVKDSLFNKSMANNIKDIQLGEERKQSDAIIEQKDTSLWKSHIITIILTINCLLAFAVMYFIYRSLKSSKLTKRAMGDNILRMLDERETRQRELFRSQLEHDALVSRVRVFLSGPVATLSGLGNVYKNATGVEEYKACLDKMNWLCANISTVLDNMQELVMIKNLDLTLEEIDMHELAEDIGKNFKKVNKFLLPTITIQRSVRRKIKSDKKILLSLIGQAILYFDNAYENPVVEVLIDQVENDGVTRISINHYSTGTTLLPGQNEFNYLTAVVAAGKLNGTVMLSHHADHTRFEFSIPTILTLTGNVRVAENIIMK